MIKHIVLYKFVDENKEVFMKQAKQQLESLVDKIDELKGMEIGISYLGNDNMPDLSLTSSFESKEGFKAYTTHPEHLKVVSFFKPMVVDRWIVDFEV